MVNNSYKKLLVLIKKTLKKNIYNYKSLSIFINRKLKKQNLLLLLYFLKILQKSIKKCNLTMHHLLLKKINCLFFLKKNKQLIHEVFIKSIKKKRSMNIVVKFFKNSIKDTEIMHLMLNFFIFVRKKSNKELNNLTKIKKLLNWFFSILENKIKQKLYFRYCAILIINNVLKSYNIKTNNRFKNKINAELISRVFHYHFHNYFYDSDKNKKMMFSFFTNNQILPKNLYTQINKPNFISLYKYTYNRDYSIRSLEASKRLPLVSSILNKLIYLKVFSLKKKNNLCLLYRKFNIITRLGRKRKKNLLYMRFFRSFFKATHIKKSRKAKRKIKSFLKLRNKKNKYIIYSLCNYFESMKPNLLSKVASMYSCFFFNKLILFYSNKTFLKRFKEILISKVKLNMKKIVLERIRNKEYFNYIYINLTKFIYIRKLFLTRITKKKPQEYLNKMRIWRIFFERKKLNLCFNLVKYEKLLKKSIGPRVRKVLRKSVDSNKKKSLSYFGTFSIKKSNIFIVIYNGYGNVVVSTSLGLCKIKQKKKKKSIDAVVTIAEMTAKKAINKNITRLTRFDVPVSTRKIWKIIAKSFKTNGLFLDFIRLLKKKPHCLPLRKKKIRRI